MVDVVLASAGLTGEQIGLIVLGVINLCLAVINAAGKASASKVAELEREVQECKQDRQQALADNTRLTNENLRLFNENLTLMKRMLLEEKAT